MYVFNWIPAQRVQTVLKYHENIRFFFKQALNMVFKNT